MAITDAWGSQILPISDVVVVQGWVTSHDPDRESFSLFDGRDDWNVIVAALPGAQQPTIEIGTAVRVEGVESERTVTARRIEVLSTAAKTPFDTATPDDGVSAVRSRYRYLEFRNSVFQQRFRLRHRIWLEVSRLLDSRGYIHIETPMLAMPSASGANEFAVTSTRDAALRYALPQSPQLYGHLLAIGGVSRYFQWGRCFRDEDLRVNRQPEFTQLHLEAAFANEDMLMGLVEEVIGCCFELAGLGAALHFERLAFQDAQRLYGSDKPDLRLACGFTLLPCNLIEDARESPLFTCTFPAARDFAPDEILELTHIVARRRMRVVGFLHQSGLQRARFPMRVDRAELAAFLHASETYSPGAQLLVCGDWSGHAKLSRDLYQWMSGRPERPSDSYRLVWICDFPLFEADPGEKGRLRAFSHPFTAPQDPAGLAGATRNHELLTLRGRSFDLVLNGEEIGSGSMLIGDPDLQNAVFNKLGYSKKDVRSMFGVLMDALACGAPPIGGFGLGVDRLTAFLTGTDKIRDVVAFPKSRNGLCPVLQSR